MWDIRSQKPAFRFKDGSPHDDIIMDFALREDKATLVSCSGDGTVSAIDLRKGRVLAQSDNQESALLSCAIIKGGSKVVVGTQDGPLHIFSWGRFGDMDDRLVGPEGSVDCLAPAGASDSGLVFSGGEDGLVRLVGVQPHRVVRVVGEHGDEPVQAMRLSRCGGLLGSCALDDSLRFWDVRSVRDGDVVEGAGGSGGRSTDATYAGGSGSSSGAGEGAGEGAGGAAAGGAGAGSSSAGRGAAGASAWKPSEARRAMDKSDFYRDFGGMEDGEDPDGGGMT